MIKPFNVPQRTDLKWAAVDLDGTLAEPVWPEPGIGEVIDGAYSKLWELHDNGYSIVIFTSRPWSDHELIEQWMIKNALPFEQIVCGKLLAAIYCDDRNVLIGDTSWLPS